MFTVKQARQYSGYTQEQMAEHLGITRAAYMYLEKHPDRTTVEQAKRFCLITGIALDDIFFTQNST